MWEFASLLMTSSDHQRHCQHHRHATHPLMTHTALHRHRSTRHSRSYRHTHDTASTSISSAPVSTCYRRRRRRRWRVVGSDRSVALEWPRPTACLHRVAMAALLLTRRSWSVCLVRSRPGGRFHVGSGGRPTDSSTWRSMAWCAGVLSGNLATMSEYGIATSANPVRHRCETSA